MSGMPSSVQVAERVEHLVPRELVREPEAARVQDRELVHDDGIVEAAAPGESGRFHPLDVAHEAEGASARHLAREGAIGEDEGEGLIR